MKGFFDKVQHYVDNCNDVIITTGSNGYVALIKHEFEHDGTMTIIEYNEHNNTIDTVNVSTNILKRYL